MRVAVYPVVFLLTASLVASADLDPVVADLKSKDAKVRLKAVESLGAAGKDAAPFLRQLCDATMDPNPKVVAAALQAVGKVEPKLAKPLSDLVIPSNVKTTVPVASLGADAVGSLRADGRPAAGVMLAVLKAEMGKGEKANSATTRSMLAALANVGADDEATVKTCGAILGTNGVPTTHRTFAMAYFAAMIQEKAERFGAAKGYIEAAIAAPETQFSTRVIVSVGTMGSTAAPLLPVLERAKLSQDPVIRRAAFDAAARIVKDRDAKKE